MDEQWDDEWTDPDRTDGWEEEAGYVCDHCGEEIVVPLDISAGTHQHYVEDCPVCCNPNEIHVDFADDGAATVWSRAEQDRY